MFLPKTPILATDEPIGTINKGDDLVDNTVMRTDDHILLVDDKSQLGNEDSFISIKTKDPKKPGLFQQLGNNTVASVPTKDAQTESGSPRPGKSFDSRKDSKAEMSA